MRPLAKSRYAAIAQAALPLLLLALAFGSTAVAQQQFLVRERVRQQLHQLVSTNDVRKDVFTLLSEPQRNAWAPGDSRSIAELRSLFTSIPTRVIIEVKLVGFDLMTGEDAVTVHPDALASHLHTLQQELSSVVLQPELRHLLIKPTVQFQVSTSNRILADKISMELSKAAHAERARPDRHPHEQLQLNYRTVDRLIADDAAASRGPATAAGVESVAALTIYLLNPRSPSDKLEEYLYSYEEPGDAKPEESRSCPGTSYVSSTSPAYVWVDIRAGPTSYGPGAGHRGQVHSHTLPHPLHYKKHLVNQTIVPDLAALVWSAVQHMAWPPLLHTHISAKPHLLVHVVHIHDTLGAPPDRLDQDAIGELLQQALGDMQKVEVKESFLAFAHCDLCVSIYASALKVRTAREEGDVYLQARTAKILDRMALHRGLLEHMDSILTGFPLFGSHGAGYDETSDRHVLPVFVFDISDGGENGILIDGLVKATAFKDMVIAVSSQAKKAPTHFRCKWSQASPPADNVTREVLGAALSAGWGVPDTATYYSGAGENEDYRWSVGNTPFGPLSYRLSINAVLAQAMRRNLIVSHLEAGIARVLRLLDAFAQLSKSGRLERKVTFEHHAALMQRLNIVHFKVSEAVRLLGQWQAPAALKMTLSLRHDVEALERVARLISVRMETGVVRCAGATTWRDVWWAPVGALALWPLAFWVRSRIYAPPKADKIY